MASLLDLLLPAYCELCHLQSGGPALCEICLGDLPRNRVACPSCATPLVEPLICADCQRRPPPWDRCIVPLLYTGDARRLILRLKRSGSPALATALLDAAAVEIRDADVTVPIPSTVWRTLRRGHNPAEVLARALPRHRVPPVRPALLRRRAGPRQTGTSRALRARNVRGVFTAAGRVPNHVLLVDDVMTSGATLREASTVLRRAGAERITVYAIARTPT